MRSPFARSAPIAAAIATALLVGCAEELGSEPGSAGPRAVSLLDSEHAAWHTRRAPARPAGSRDDPIRDARNEVERRWLDSRRAVELAVGERFDVELALPTAARLRFDLRLATETPGSALALIVWEWSFWPEGGGAPLTLGLGQVPVRPPDGGGWRSEVLDLGGSDALASLRGGRRGTLTFATRAAPGSTPPEDLVVALGTPVLTVAGDARPSVLFVSVDTLRRDLLAPWGGEAALTPNLLALAAESVVVERAWSTAPWTLPSYASLFTAEYPSTHGAGLDPEGDWEKGAPPLRGISPELEHLVERFASAGYATQAFHDNANLRRGTGNERGFDGYVHYGATGRAAVNGLRDWLGSVRQRPFFAFVHLADVHSPYVPPASYEPPGGAPDPASVPSLNADAHLLREQGVPTEERADFEALYRAVVGYMDQLVGELESVLAESGRAENTLVVFHADHGEEFWDHGGWFHGQGHHVELIAVPLLFRFPGRLPAGERVAGDFRGVDVMPTVLDLVGLWGANEALEGRSLAAALRGERLQPPPALSESTLFGQPSDHAVTRWPWRLIVPEDGPAELYDLESDPEERRDRAAERPDLVAELMREGAFLRERAAQRRRGTSAQLEVDETTRQQLGAMGYLGDED